MAEQLIAHGWANRPNYLKHIWQRYRLNNETFQALWNEQQGKCAGCDRTLAHPFVKQFTQALKPEVDHCHSLEISDKRYVRGILCHKCNELLGKLRDNKETLQRLARYLKRHGESLSDVL